MDTRNNFQRLAELEEKSAPPIPSDIESKVSANVGFVSYVGNIFDLYIPKLMQLIVAFLGGTEQADFAQHRGDPPDRIEDNEIHPRGK